MLEGMACESDVPIVIFGHSLFLSAMIPYISSHKQFMPTKPELVFRFPNCSISTFEFSEDKGWQIFNGASIAHMPLELCTGRECEFGNPIDEDLECSHSTDEEEEMPEPFKNPGALREALIPSFKNPGALREALIPSFKNIDEQEENKKMK